MSASGGSAGHPSGDTRFERLDAALRRWQHQPEALLELLHEAQALFGFLPEDVLGYVGRGLRLPPSRVYGVATFYILFSLRPRGRHTCTVCNGTACYVKGAGGILAGLERAHGLAAGGTTDDGQLSLVVARCVGACGAAPAVLYDHELAGAQSLEEALARVAGWRSPP
jgi:bidirectional [NiFe] hydrogenase diaphorase subunit